MLSKDFKTITLRNLDDKPKVVESLNKIMKKELLATGQSAIEFIIQDYVRITAELEELKKKHKTFSDNQYKYSQEKEAQIKELEATLKTIKGTFDLITKLKLPK